MCEECNMVYDLENLPPNVYILRHFATRKNNTEILLLFQYVLAYYNLFL